MFKNLNANLLGITGRQSELIELALTYGFRGLNIDMVDLLKRSERTSFESASRFLLSSKLSLSGFDAPIDLDADEASFAESLKKLPAVADLAKRIGATAAFLQLPPGTDRLPFHEYFNVARKRIDDIANIFGKEDVNVALHFNAVPSQAAGKQFKFVTDVEGFLGLFRACTSPRVGIVFDSWQWHVGSGKFEQVVDLPIAKIFGLRLADIAEDADLANLEIKDRLLPGTNSSIDNVSYVRHFSTNGYKGCVSAMGHPAGESQIRRDALVALAQDALDKVLEEAGVPCQTRKPESFATAGNYNGID